MHATQIPDEDLELILQTGTYAPSGANTQPWHFSVVQNAELLEKLNSIIKEMYINSDIPRMRERAQEDDFSIFYKAPTLIIISADETKLTPQLDSALAMGNMFNAAASLGIGSCWINAIPRLFETEESLPLREELLIPEGFKVYAAGSFGYPSGEWPEPAPRTENMIDYIR